ncbi:hypothetical protein [Bailinhaonella thermotolerans]|uniref:VWFA domain-containing protein n=1 Tax=Bailinhaonella thermotolerans TaxID=1070861 RepID=A0A3A4AQE5_9ACTN|nr:hypothetical protein [Bailinhaonella thermotolerans]RJL31281.1 hypothetical protein D5H75_19670 [Bailinhaonella thermotolerans]
MPWPNDDKPKRASSVYLAILAFTSAVIYAVANSQLDDVLELPREAAWAIIGVAVVILILATAREVDGLRLPRGLRRTAAAVRRRLPGSVIGIPISRFALFTAAVMFVLVGSVATAALVGAGAAAVCAPPEEVRVLASRENLEVARAAADRFADTRQRPGECRKVRFTVYAAPGGAQTRDALREGWPEAHLALIGPRPDLVLPDSAADLRLVGRETPAGRALNPAGSLGSSPLVLAVPERAAQAMGPDHTGATIAELLARLGETGVGLARPDPVTSTSALLHTQGVYAGMLGDEPAAFERRLGRTDLNTADAGALLCDLRERRRDDVAALVPEYLMLAYNRGEAIGSCPRVAEGSPPRLVAYYPRDVARLDFPCVPAPPYGQDEVRRGWAEAFCEWTRLSEPPPGLRDPQGNLSGSPGPSGDVERAVPHATAAPAAGELLKTLDRLAGARRPARILVAIDASESMREVMRGGTSRLSVAVLGARSMMRQVGPRDQTGLWSFSDPGKGPASHRELVPIGPARAAQLPGHRARFERALAGVSARAPWTPLYDAIADGSRELARSAPREPGAPPPVRTLLVFTDGVNDAEGGRDVAAVLDELARLREQGVAPRVFLAVLGDRPCDKVGLTGAPEVTCRNVTVNTLDDAVGDMLRTVWGVS